MTYEQEKRLLLWAIIAWLVIVIGGLLRAKDNDPFKVFSVFIPIFGISFVVAKLWIADSIRRIVYFKTKLCRDGTWTVWCGLLPLVADDPVSEPYKRDIFFNVCRVSKEAALLELKAEVETRPGKYIWLDQSSNGGK